MNNSGKTSSTEKRHRSRVAPRPHLDPSEQPATYDSNEFPVLLRMPDVSRPSTKPELPARKESIQSPPSAPTTSDASANASSTTKSRHKRRENGSEPAKTTSKPERHWTAGAAGRFWSTIPPQLAAGGMLLAVIALCFVLLRSSDPAPSPSKQSDWAGKDAPSENQNLANVPQEPQEKGATPVLGPPFSNGGVAKQVEAIAVKPTATEFNSPIPERAASELAEIPQDSVGGWPTAADLVPSSAAPGDDVSPIEAWPGAPESPSLYDNSSTISAQNSTMPSVRTSQRMPTYSGTNPSTDTPYLNGTVEIPPPTKIRRQ